MSPRELILVFMTVCGGLQLGDSCVLEAHENGSVTLEWWFPSGIALTPLDIICEQDQPDTNQTSRELFFQFKDREGVWFQNNHFRSRVQVERAGLRDGLFRVHISALRLDDSGLYSCTFYSSNGRNSSKCQLSVTGESRRIVLLGKTGTGKSSLANTILGVQNLFKVSHKAKSETNTCVSETRNVCDKNITVIDTPGVFDTDPRSSELSPELLKCVQECAPGPHAFLLVLKVERFTQQEQAVVDLILKYFSEEALEYTTVVFTHGDQIEEGLTIKEWIKDNDALSTLVQRCGGRCHVFDNKHWRNTQDPYRNNQHQVTELLKTIEQTVRRNGGRCYTNEMLKMIDGEIKQEVIRIQASSSQRIRLRDIVQEAKNRMYAKILKNLEGAVVMMVTIVVTRSPDLLRCVAAGGTGAVVVAPTGALMGAWASERWSSPTEAVRDAREFLREVELLIQQGRDILNIFDNR